MLASDIITEAQLKKDIAELPADYNTGRPAALVSLSKKFDARMRRKNIDRKTSRARASIEKAIRARNRKNSTSKALPFSGKNSLLSVQISNLRKFNKAK